MRTYQDPALAAVHIELQPTDDGGMTNAATLLVRPTALHSDESGEHPGETFYLVSLTRDEALGVLQDLEDDWEDHCLATDLMANPQPLLTTQAAGRINVLLSLLDSALEVLNTIDPESDEEGAALATLTDHISRAVADCRQGA